MKAKTNHYCTLPGFSTSETIWPTLCGLVINIEEPGRQHEAQMFSHHTTIEEASKKLGYVVCKKCAENPRVPIFILAATEIE